MNPLLEISRLRLACRSQEKPLQLLHGIDLKVFPGQTTAIVGESGSGKSLTALSILRLYPSRSLQVEEGKIQFEGVNLLEKSEKGMRSIRGKEIGVVFQNPMSSLNPTMTVGAQLIEGLRYHCNLSRHDAAAEAIRLLKQVEIPHPEKCFWDYPHQLSGGMQQRVIIGMAIACKPKLLIADEPTTALDVTIQAQILRLLKTIQQQTKIAILLITHDLGIVAEMCDQVAVMERGKIVEYGPVGQVFSHPQHEHTRALLESKRKIYSIL